MPKPKFPSQRQDPILKETPRSSKTQRAEPSFVRILRVWEYEMIRDAAKTTDNQTRLDALLLTAMRYVEAQRLQKHREWLQGRAIHLTSIASRKARRTQVDRWVKLSDMGVAILPFFFKVKELPSWDAWHDNLERWALKAGLNPVGLSPKTTRKSYESWLIYSFPNRLVEVLLSQGHTETVSLEHYLNMPFVDEDRKQMERWVRGWG
jgi:integrase